MSIEKIPETEKCNLPERVKADWTLIYEKALNALPEKLNKGEVAGIVVLPEDSFINEWSEGLPTKYLLARNKLVQSLKGHTLPEGGLLIAWEGNEGSDVEVIASDSRALGCCLDIISRHNSAKMGDVISPSENHAVCARRELAIEHAKAMRVNEGAEQTDDPTRFIVLQKVEKSYEIEKDWDRGYFSMVMEGEGAGGGIDGIMTELKKAGVAVEIEPEVSSDANDSANQRIKYLLEVQNLNEAFNDLRGLWALLDKLKKKYNLDIEELGYVKLNRVATE